MSTTIFRKNFSHRQIDCSAYSGDLIFEECNLSQENTDTGQGQIFINTGNLTSLTCLNSNCVNHGQPPLGGVVYDGCNIIQRVRPVSIEVSLRMSSDITKQLKMTWMAIADHIVANSGTTYADFKLWYVANQGHTIFYVDTFLTMIIERLNEEVSVGVTWADAKTWIIDNRNKEGFRRVLG